jgi:hypothetical protein
MSFLAGSGRRTARYCTQFRGLAGVGVLDWSYVDEALGRCAFAPGLRGAVPGIRLKNQLHFGVE